MNICFLMPPIEYYSPEIGGAIATKTMQKGRILMARGHHVTVLSPQSKNAAYEVGKVVAIRAETRDTLHKARRAVSRLRRIYNHWDWLYYEYYIASVTRTLKQLTPKPDAVLVFNDLITPQYVKRAVPEARVLSMLSNEIRTNQKDIAETIRSVTKFVTVSSYIEKWTREEYNIPAHQIMTITNGADTTSFSPRADYLEFPKTLRVLFIGRINPDKGPDIAADAVGVLQSEGLPVTLSVAGGIWFYGNDDQMANPFFRTLKTKMEAIHADYLGHVTRDKVPELVRSHDVVCVLSRWNDPMPQTAFEAMASGCALLASDRGGIPEACGGAALLVDPDDFESVVCTLRRLATEPDFLSAAKQKSVARAREVTWAKNVDQLEKVLMGQETIEAS